MPAMIYNGKIYGASSTLADDIIYDNTNSGLRAGTVGEAIDELVVNGVGGGSNGVNFVFNEDGSIQGYTTSIGGADTVFPFKSGMNGLKLVALSNNFQTSGGATIKVYDDDFVEATNSGSVVTVTIKKDSTYRLVFFGFVRGSSNQANAYLKINDVAYSSGISSASTNYDEEHTLSAGDVITVSTNTTTSTSGGVSCATFAILSSSQPTSSSESVFDTFIPVGHAYQMYDTGTLTDISSSKKVSYDGMRGAVVVNVKGLGWTKATSSASTIHVTAIKSDGTYTFTQAESVTFDSDVVFLLIKHSRSNTDTVSVTFS